MCQAVRGVGVDDEVGEQLPLISGKDAGAFITTTLLRSRPTSCTASAADEPTTSITASTWPSLNHSRALLEARSALVCVSAARISIERFSTLPPKSATAISAAALLPSPVMSA